MSTANNIAKPTASAGPPVRVTVAEPDLVEAWSLLEYLVVSLRRIGTHYATPAEDVPQTTRQRQEMLDDLGRLMGHETFRKLSRARTSLGKYLPDPEAEAISDALAYFEPTGEASAGKRPAPSTR
jgi:hypothetical protein